MDYFTTGKIQETTRITPVVCIDQDTCKDMDIRGKCFLLLIVVSGSAVFRFGEEEIVANAPCFVTFSEEHKPELIRKKKLQVKAIYFHPTFMNINLTFEFLRDGRFTDLASVHDLFMMSPFLQHHVAIPIIDGYMPRLLGAFEEMHLQLTHQPDDFWSCRARAGFIDIIMALETHYRMLISGKLTVDGQVTKEITCPFVKRALYHIESYYMEKVTFAQILMASGTNHTTLTRNFKEETGRTVMDYLQHYRIEMAKKHLRFTEMPLKDIARQCGFATTEHFSRVFTSEAGTPPASFRRQAVDKRKEEINPLVQEKK